MIRSLPTGTVTFLFTDLEGSTTLWEQDPEGMKAALARHDGILRQAIDAHGGMIVKTTGDGIHAVFPTALAAVTAALKAQQALQAETWEIIQGRPLRVRMGLHTGEAELRAGDYYGSATNRAARLMAIGSGGQVLLSLATAELLRGGLPDGASLRDLGEHRLKDLPHPQRIYQLVHPALLSDFSPVKSLDNSPNNLPTQLTSFIGREKEVNDILHLLEASRLVTLTGSGGTGKTRLAQEVGAQALPQFFHGVWMVELAPLSDPEQIIPALARVLGVQEQQHTPLNKLVGDYLRDKNALLILDNCEHLIAACARLADGLLRQSAKLKMLASSREALGIAGEVAYRVPSLDIPEATRLFNERAAAANSGFHAGETHLPAVSRICTRLDGIPLAIELAAARTKFLTPEQIAARLDDRFRLLIGGSRTAIPRQQTLRALIDWSYDLLSDQEKRLLRVASVFTGGWTLEALEAVALEAVGGDTGNVDTMEQLEQLVNKSLVVADERDNAMRYTLLETIRQYAREKLMDAGVEEAACTRDRHMDYFLHFVQNIEEKIKGADALRGLNALDTELDNIRAALEWASDHNMLAALGMISGLTLFWGRRGSAVEGYAWVNEILARAENATPAEGEARTEFLVQRARALSSKANLALQIGDNIAADQAVEAAIALERQVDDPQGLAYALAIGSTILGFQGKVHRARDWARESSVISRQHGFAYEYAMVAGSNLFLAVVANETPPEGLDIEGIRAARACGNPYLIGLAISNAGRHASHQGQWEKAYSLLEEAANLFLQAHDRSFYPICRSEIGHLFRKQGRYAEAEAIYRETILAFQELGQRAAVAHEIECFAFIAQARGQYTRAATLLGAAEKLRETMQADMMSMEIHEYETALSHLRAQINEPAFSEAWASGRAMTMETAIQYALS